MKRGKKEIEKEQRRKEVGEEEGAEMENEEEMEEEDKETEEVGESKDSEQHGKWRRHFLLMQGAFYCEDLNPASGKDEKLPPVC
ncbi:hypothetical protein HispidOSU_024802 [Sigmodon hispidus]